MVIKFLGRWSSNLVPHERNVSFVLDDKIAFDFGPHSLESLLDIGINPNRISLLLITHMHLDHYAGIAELLWYRSIYRARNSLTVLGPKGIRKDTEQLMRLVHTPPLWYEEQINERVRYVEDSDYDFVGIFHAKHAIPCNSYRVEYGRKTIFYSGDTSYSKRVVEGARDVDWLFHELTYTDRDRKLAEKWGHSTYGDVMRVFKESGARHLVPVHLTRSSSALVARRAGTVTGLIYPPESLEL